MTISKIVTDEGDEATATNGVWTSSNNELMNKLNSEFNSESFSPHGGSPESLDDHLAMEAAKAIGGRVTENVPLQYKYVQGRVY